MLAGVFGGLPPMPEPPMKRKCLLPGCDNLTAHNGGYCCAEHHTKHKQPNSYSVEVSRSSFCLIFIILHLSNGSVKLIYGA
jgi:hypothetical protein